MIAERREEEERGGGDSLKKKLKRYLRGQFDYASLKGHEEEAAAMLEAEAVDWFVNRGLEYPKHDIGRIAREVVQSALRDWEGGLEREDAGWSLGKTRGTKAPEYRMS